MTGIEPASPAWKAGALAIELHPQLLYRINTVRCTLLLTNKVVGMQGFEPWASWSQTRRANQAAPHPEKEKFNTLGTQNFT